ncbi:hypothetical protein [Gemmata obscuriglobus]|nr:hypothetical protein [Gemmata obscuriglobus]
MEQYIPNMDESKDEKPLVIRDEQGRLLPGSKLSKGVRNPAAATQHSLQRQFRETVGTDRFRDVVERHLQLIAEAAPKDAKGLIELLYSYYLGRPKEHIEMDVTQSTPPVALNLDTTDLAALHRMRQKLSAVNDDEDDVIELNPNGEA